MTCDVRRYALRTAVLELRVLLITVLCTVSTVPVKTTTAHVLPGMNENNDRKVASSAVESYSSCFALASHMLDLKTMNVARILFLLSLARVAYKNSIYHTR